MSSIRLLRMLVAASLLGGCGSVNPSREFDRTGALIRESTGANEVFHPAEPLLTSEEIDARLADGLSIQEAIDLGLRNSRDLQAEFLRIGVAKADWVQSGLLSNPTLGLAVLLPEGGGRSFLGASIAQNLVDLWQIPLRRRVATHELERTVLHVARIAGELAVSIREKYYEALIERQRLDLLQSHMQLLRRSHEGVGGRRRGGAATEFDENLAMAEVLGGEIAVGNAELLAGQARRSLARTLAIDRDLADVTLSDDLPGPPGAPLDAEPLIRLARASRLDLRARAEAVAGAARSVQAERSQLIGQASVGITHERDARRGGDGDAADRRTGPILSVEVPLFDQNRARTSRAGYVYQGLVKEYESLSLAVGQDVRSAVARLNNASRSLAFYRDQLLPQAERNLGFATESYQAGQTTLLTLLQAQRGLIEARRGQLDVSRETALGLVGVERSVGVPWTKILLGSP